MGDFFDDLGKRITETADAVSKRTEELVETQKVKTQIRTLKRNLERDFEDLGIMLYSRYQMGEEVAEEFKELCEMITKREENIAEYEREIAEIKGEAVCTGCSKPTIRAMKFCPECGTKLGEDV